MPAMAVDVKVDFRSGGGQFMRPHDAAKTAALQAIARAGAGVAQDIVGGNRYKTGALWGNIVGRVDGNKALVVSYDPKTNLIIDGSPPHPIVGKPWLKFYWQREGRMFEPGFKRGFGPPDSVNHPGFPGIDFLTPAFEHMGEVALDYVETYMGF